MKPTLSEILVIIGVIAGLIVLMRWIQPKLTPKEQYLLRIVQRKSPQMDNIRLFMWVKMVIHQVDEKADLAYQDLYLLDPQKYKELCEQFLFFGHTALYPFFGYEALNWNLDPTELNPLAVRLAANQVCRRYPQSAVVIEELLIRSPDPVTEESIKGKKAGFSDLEIIRRRYSANLLAILQIIASTPRNEWWPGTSSDIREWAETTLAKYKK